MIFLSVTLFFSEECPSLAYCALDFVSQTTNSVLLVAPVGFHLNPETAEDNVFMHKMNAEQDEIQSSDSCGGLALLIRPIGIVLDEFRQAYLALVRCGVNVTVKVGELFHNAPDAVFPNNWFSTHAKNDVRSCHLFVVVV